MMHHKSLRKKSKKATNKRDSVCVVTSLNFKLTITFAAEKRNYDWSNEGMRRIVNEIYLVAAQSRYIDHVFENSFARRKRQTAGRPADVDVASIIEFISSYSKNNKDERQFNLRKILCNYEDDIRSEATIRKLEEKYSNVSCQICTNDLFPSSGPQSTY